LTNRLFSSKIFKVALHLVVWLCFYFFFFNVADSPSSFYTLKVSCLCVLLAGFFYLNTEVLIPKFLGRKKILVYLLIITSIIAAIVIFNYLFHRLCSEQGQHHDDHRFEAMMIRVSFFTTFMVFAISTSIRLVNEWYKSEQQKKEMEKEKLSSELSFLKSQVNPHFLFNTLNNIYALAYKKSDSAPEAIAKLSQLMRYMLCETNDKRVSLDKEIEYLHNYIDLQRLRISDTVKISFDITGDTSGIDLEPMLLIPFVENAFTHGVSYREPSVISVSLKVDEEKHVCFTVENNIFTEQADIRDSSHGIGLQNVKKRLELLYPLTHQLRMNIENNKYVVILIISNL
jgi:two-component system LytT family sensor kinase